MRILISIDDETKIYLDFFKAKGFTTSGFIRGLIRERYLEWVNNTESQATQSNPPIKSIAPEGIRYIADNEVSIDDTI